MSDSICGKSSFVLDGMSELYPAREILQEIFARRADVIFFLTNVEGGG
jgi:hypothetical protein